MVETPFDELEVVNGLRKSSPEFNDFYQNERLKYVDEIKWLQETNLKEGLGAYAAIDRDEISNKIITRKIYFKKFPDSNDDFLIAHEIMHVIRAIEDKSLVFKMDEPYSHLGTAFRNMIEDPIVDSFLKVKYNFDLLAKYKEGLKLPKWELDQIDKEPTEEVRKLELMLNLIKLSLCWNLIKERKTEKEWIDYRKTFKAKCPITWKMSRKFLSFIHKTRVDTKEEQKLIMKKFNDRFNRPHKE